jgi:hypothetical protein
MTDKSNVESNPGQAKSNEPGDRPAAPSAPSPSPSVADLERFHGVKPGQRPEPSAAERNRRP